MNKLFGGVGLPSLLKDVDSPCLTIKIYMAKTDALETQMLTQRILKEIIPAPVVEAAGKCAHFASRVLNALAATMNLTVLWAIAKPIRP